MTQPANLYNFDARWTAPRMMSVALDRAERRCGQMLRGSAEAGTRATKTGNVNQHSRVLPLPSPDR